MKRHWRYATHFVLWKWYVFRAGMKTKAPLWRLLIHDLHRLRPTIWLAYANYLHGPTADAQRWMATFLGNLYGASVLDASPELEDVARLAYNDERKRATNRFLAARLRLLHRSPWSWTWHILRDEMQAQPDALEMPEALVRVQLADWIASVRDQHGEWDMEKLRRFYAYRRQNIKLHANTRKLFDRLLNEVAV